LACLVGALPALAARAGSIDLAARDTTCAPCRDFFQYANGVWLERAEIPSTHPGIGSFQGLDDRNEETLRELLDEVARDPHPARGGDAERLGIFYGSCM